jgi:hypothetical protein
MAETLGEAVLVLRTDDRGLTAGMGNAQGRAEALGRSLDDTAGAAGDLGKSLETSGASALTLAQRMGELASSGDRGVKAFIAADAAISRLSVAQARATAELASAKAAYQAGEISLAQYNGEALRTRTALSLVEAEYAKAATELRKAIVVTDDATASHGRMSMSSMLMMHSVRSATDSFAAGLPPMMILTEQMSRMGEAAALSEGALGGVGAIMAGPWGIAILASISVLSVIIGKMDLFATAADKDAAALKGVALATDNLSDLQSTLGQVFDITTGKITEQSGALRALAEAQLLVAKAKAETNLAEADRKLGDMQKPEFHADQASLISHEKGPQADIIAMYLRGEYGNAGGSGAMRDLQTLRGSGKISTETYLSGIQAISSHEAEALNVTRADKAIDSLQSGHLDPEFLKPNKAKKGPADHSFQDANAFAQEMDKLNEELARTKRQNITDIEQLAAIDKADVDAARVKERDAIAGQAHQHHWTEAQAEAAQLKADEVAQAKKDAIDVKTKRELADKDLQLQANIRGSEADMLNLQMQMAVTAKERLIIALSLLDHDYKMKRIADQKALTDGQIDQIEFNRRQAEYAQQKPLAEKLVAQQHASPLDAYAKSLEDQRTARGEKVQGLIVSELDWVNQSIDSAITSRLGIKDPLLAGLIDMFIKDVLIRPIAQALQNAQAGGGGGAGIFGSIFGSIFGGGGLSGIQTSGQFGLDNFSPVGSSTGGGFAGMFADGGLIPAGGFGIVGERGPEAIFSTSGGVGVLPNSALRSFGQGGGGAGNATPGKLEVSVSGARGNAEISAMVQAGIAQGLAAYDAQVGNRVQDNLARRG